MHNLVLNLVAALAAAAPGINVSVVQDTPAPQQRQERVIVMTGAEAEGGLDKNSDGFITRDEFTAPMDGAWARMDTDGDGRIPVAEFHSMHNASGNGEDVQVMVRRGPGGHHGPAAQHMVELHGAAEGPGEHRIHVRQFGGEGDKQPMDSNGDGRVSEDEFMAPMREAFREMDADRSGSLEEGERHGRRIIHHEVRREGGAPAAD